MKRIPLLLLLTAFWVYGCKKVIDDRYLVEQTDKTFKNDYSTAFKLNATDNNKIIKPALLNFDSRQAVTISGLGKAYLIPITKPFISKTTKGYLHLFAVYLPSNNSIYQLFTIE